MLTALPAFNTLNPAEVGEQLDAVLAKNRQELAALLKQPRHDWSSLIEPLEEMGERLSRVWGPISHLFGVWSTPEWRAAYNAGLPKVTEYSVEVSQNEALFRAYESLANSPAFATYSPTRKKIITDALRDFRLSGIALPEKEKARYKEISLKLSELQSKFEENIMDCTQAWSKPVTDESLLAGMTDAAKTAAQEKAKAKGLDGWLLTLDYPSYDAVITRATNRELRQELYRAYATRAAASPHDNTALMAEILALRHEQAQMLGFKNYAELSLATKMADSPAEVESFLRDLARKARARAETELAELRTLAKADGIADLQAWDTAYYSEKLREKTLGLSDETLRPYFPFPQVLQGLFDLVERLYGVEIEAQSGMPVWHADVGTYVLKRDGKIFGGFYLDPYARPETKRGGAWMDECSGRRRLAGGIQSPVAYLVCNFTPPMRGGDTAPSRSEAGAGADSRAASNTKPHTIRGTTVDAARQPALLTHDEVLTLFHEFGHGLHHLLTRVDESAVSGIRGVEWDAVELPSQFMENWCYEPTTLQLFARHWQTGEAMPQAMIEQLRADRQFQSGLATLRQVEFSLFDMRLHTEARPDVLTTLNVVRKEVAVLNPPDWNRMPWSFSHIFAGGYAAGYYSYKWAEVLSSDAFAAFEETNFAPETGQEFRDQILAAGGSRPAMDSFIAFRGRKPVIEPLLRHSGLLQAA